MLAAWTVATPPAPPGRCTWATCRTALLAWLYARSQGSRFLMRIEDLDPQRSRREFEEGQLGGPERARHRLGRPGRAPVRAPRAPSRGAGAASHLPVLVHAQGDPRGHPGPPRRRGALPGHLPRPRARGDGRRPFGWTPGRAGFTDRLHGESSARSMTSFCGERTTCRRTTSRWWSTTRTPASRRSCAARTCSDTTPRQVLLQQLLGLPTPAYTHVPLVLDQTASGMAKREADETRSLSWMAESLGLAEPGEPVTTGQLLDRFDPIGWRP